MQIPSRAELKRFFDAEQADEVHYLETITSWPSLRILDYLYGNEPVTTGDIARALNMDMRDVKDHLTELENHDTVEETDDGWKTQTDRIRITLTQNNGLNITHTTGHDKRENDEPTKQKNDQETNQSMLGSVRQWMSSLFSFV